MMLGDAILVVAQGLLGLACFTLPGVIIFSMTARKTAAAWPLAWLLSASFILSSLAIVAVTALTTHFLVPVAARALSFAIAGGSLVYVLKQRRDNLLVAAWLRTDRWERIGLATTALVGLFWLVSLPLSPYPSLISVQLGDPPMYFRTAANVAEGRGWCADYLIGDGFDGQAPYVTRQPLPVLVTSFLFHLFGVNWHSLYVYDIVAAMLLVYVLGAFVTSARPNTVRAGPVFFGMVLFLLFTPSYFLMAGLGAHTIPGALGFATAALFWARDPSPTKRTVFMLAAAFLYMLCLRPESAFLALICALVVGVWWWFKYCARSTLARAMTIGGLAVVLLLAWSQLPTICRACPAVVRGTTINYLRYDPDTRRFVPLYGVWWYEINRRLCLVNLSGAAPDVAAGNAEALSEIHAHPLAFAGYLAKSFASSTSVQYMSAITRPMRGARDWLMCGPIGGVSAIVAVLLLLACRSGRHQPIMIAVILFVLTIPVLNPVTNLRHLLVVSPVAMACLMREVICAIPDHRPARLYRWTGIGLLLGAGLVFLRLAVSDVRTLVKVRTSPANRTYVNILKDITRLTNAGDLIASSYPQFITCLTGRRGVGGTWLVDNLDGLVRNFEPDIILVDNARDGPDNYSEFLDRKWSNPDYAVLVHNPSQRYVLLRRIRKEGQARPLESR